MRIIPKSRRSGSNDALEEKELPANPSIPAAGQQPIAHSNEKHSKAITDSVSGYSSEYSQLLGKGVRLLSMREHSVKEIRNKLAAKTEQPGLLDAVVDELLQNNYLSNERFTESYVRSRGNRGIGPVKIRAELKSKGIEDQLIDAYLNPNSTIWYENAAAQYAKKFVGKPVSDYADWSKRARFLQGRGFNMDHIHSTVPQVEID